jgi:hypothetical protein
MQEQIRKWLLVCLLLVTPLLGKEPDLRITVIVYNYAAVSGKVLAEAKAAGTRIFRETGIEVEWLDCPLSPERAVEYPSCQMPPGPDRLAIRVVSRAMAARLRLPPRVFGFALLTDDGSFPLVASVFADDAKGPGFEDVEPGAFLGNIIAHELGHLLLAVAAHSDSGIMRDHWQRSDLEFIAQGYLYFTRKERERLRAGVRDRTSGGLTAGSSLQPPRNGRR